MKSIKQKDKLVGLDPNFRKKVVRFLKKLNNENVNVQIVDAFRTDEEQRRLWMKGRNEKGKIVDRSKVVTFARTAKESPHGWGLAIDVVPLKNGKPNWAAPLELWGKIGRIGESCGLEWGGRWKKIKDMPHFQEPNWKNKIKHKKT